MTKMKSPYTKEEFEKQLADRHMSLGRSDSADPAKAHRG